MKFITISKIGYNHPKNANWSYGIYQINCVDSKKEYHNSFIAYETFGGDCRFKKILQNLNIKISEVKGVFPNQKLTGIKDIINIEKTAE